MNYTLFDLFLNAYNGNSFAQLQIVQRFQPLLKKYAALLKYEDAYSDLQLYLLELLHSGKLTKLQRKDDGTLGNILNPLSGINTFRLTAEKTP